MRINLAVLGLLFLLPSGAHAAVVVNEIAWIGTTVSANAEWMELFNTGTDAVDLTGWHLTASNGTPSIALTGSIAAGNYFLLERTSDDSVPNVTADQIYSGALTNSGATLTLTDAGGTTVDEVVGGANWVSIGGDNATKDTAQRLNNGWKTAPPTPRTATVGAVVNSSQGTTATSTAVTASAASAEIAEYTPPSSALSVSVNSPRNVLLEVPFRVSARVTTRGGGTDTATQVSWSFGDGSSAQGNVAGKTYHYPGTYVIVATATNGVATARGEVVVTVTPAQARILSISGDGITIGNDSSERLDLSGWRLTSDTGSFHIPVGTTLLPEARVLFPFSIMNMPVVFTAALSFPDGVVADRYAPAASPPPVVASAAPLKQPPPATVSYKEVQAVESPVVSGVESITSPRTNAQSHDETALAPAPVSNKETGAGAAVPPMAPVASKTPVSGIFHSPWTLGLLGVVALASVAFILL